MKGGNSKSIISLEWDFIIQQILSMGIENQLFLSSGKIVGNQFSEWELRINDFSQLGFQIIATLNQFTTLENVN